VCGSSKFERTVPVRICDAGDLDCFVTDDLPPRASREAARRGKAEILTADQGKNRVSKRS